MKFTVGLMQVDLLQSVGDLFTPSRPEITWIVDKEQKYFQTSILQRIL